MKTLISFKIFNSLKESKLKLSFYEYLTGVKNSTIDKLIQLTDTMYIYLNKLQNNFHVFIKQKNWKLL